MRPSTESHMSLYRHLGRLFYAISAADGIVRIQEQDTLKRLITKHWLGVDDYLDEFDSDCAHYIGVVFDWLVENSASSHECFHQFLLFRKKNAALFTRGVDALIWKTADSIAAGVAGRNKSEAVMLRRLREALSVHLPDNKERAAT